MELDADAFRIRFDTAQAVPAARTLARAIEDIDQEIKMLSTGFRFADQAMGAYVAEVQDLAEMQMILEAAMEETTAATRRQGSAFAAAGRSSDQVTGGLGRVKKAAGKDDGAAMGIMTLAYAADDLQYGFRSIVNNIPQVLMGLGMSQGVAGTVAILSVGVNQLHQHWGDMQNLFGYGKTKTEAEEMEALGKSTAKTAAETERLVKFKKEQSDIEELTGLKSEAEGKQSKAFKEAISEGGGMKPLVEAMAKSSIEAQGGMDQLTMNRVRKELREMYANPINQLMEQNMPGYTRTKADEILRRGKEQVYDIEFKGAQRTVAQAGEDSTGGKLKALIERLDKIPGVDPRLKAGLVMALPENVQALEDNKKAEIAGKKAKTDLEARERAMRQTTESGRETINKLVAGGAGVYKKTEESRKGKLEYGKTYQDFEEMLQEQHMVDLRQQRSIAANVQAGTRMKPGQAFAVAGSAMNKMVTGGKSQEDALIDALNEFMVYAKKTNQQIYANTQAFTRTAEKLREQRTKNQLGR